MIEIKDRQIFGKVVLDAMAAINSSNQSADAKKRWQNALKRAVELINDRPEWLTWRPELQNQLLIWSDSNEIYEANGVCTCKSFQNGFACKHRAAAKIIRNYFEALEAPSRPARLDSHNSAPYLKPDSSKRPERIGNYRI